MGGAGGLEYHQLTEHELASHQHYFFVGGTYAAHYVGVNGYYITHGSGPIGNQGGVGFTPNVPITFSGTVHTSVSGPTDHRGGNGIHNNLQPTIDA